jgi:hypothetical protein
MDPMWSNLPDDLANRILMMAVAVPVQLKHEIRLTALRFKIERHYKDIETQWTDEWAERGIRMLKEYRALGGVPEKMS